MAWVKDLIAEAKMKKMGVKWEYKTIKIADIDVKGSRFNNARVDQAIIEDMVLDYALAMMNGDAFPAIIVVHRKAGFFVLSGNNRTAAAIEAELTEIDAYVLVSDDAAVVELITRSANRWVGGRCSKKEAVVHARALIINGVSRKDAADIMGVRYDWLVQELRLDDMRDDLLKLGVDTTKVSRVAITKLMPLAHNENVLRETAALLARHKVSGEEASSLIESLKLQKSEAASMRVISEFESQFRQSAPRQDVPVKQPVRTRFLKSFNALFNTLSGKRTMRDIQVTNIDDQTELLSKWETMRSRLDGIFGVKDITHEENGSGPKKPGNKGRPRTAARR